MERILVDTCILILHQYPILEPDDITTSLKLGTDLMNRNYSIRQGG